MGLDISVYEHVTLVEEEHEREDADGNCCYEEVAWGGKGHVWAHQDVSFFHANGGLEAGRCYLHSGITRRFRAGSYSGYNEFRAHLSEAALGVSPSTVWRNPEKYADQPFWHLINFSDCEGFMGPTVCAKLAEDFKNHRVKVRPLLNAAYGFQEKYDEWQSAFELAAVDGMVDFH